MFDFMTLIILMNLNKDYKMQDVRKNFPSRISLIVRKIMTVVVLQTGKVKKYNRSQNPRYPWHLQNFEH